MHLASARHLYNDACELSAGYHVWELPRDCLRLDVLPLLRLSTAPCNINVILLFILSLS